MKNYSLIMLVFCLCCLLLLGGCEPATHVQIPQAQPAVTLENTGAPAATPAPRVPTPSAPAAQPTQPQRTTAPKPVSKTTSRIALVIGNSAYAAAPLDQPVHDAKDLASVLRNLGFEVLLKTNVDKRQFKDVVREFGQRLRPNGVGVFYFSGHGVQAKGINYLVPVNADIRSDADIEFETMDAGYVLEQMEQANSGVNIVILDACRDNPFKRNVKSVQGGLARMDSPTGSLIAYATAPGAVAFGKDGDRNSIYTKYLLAALMATPQVSITDLLIQVRNKVMQETEGQQVPWESVSLTRSFAFAE